VIRRTFYAPPEVLRVGWRWRLIWRYEPDRQHDVRSSHWTAWGAWRAARKGPPPDPMDITSG
jgi:hypothetical protein